MSIFNQKQEKSGKKDFFIKLKRSLSKTKENFSSELVKLLFKRKIDKNLFEELEERLLVSDIGINTTQKIISSVTETVNYRKLKDASGLYELIKNEMVKMLEKVNQPLVIKNEMPFVILMVGVNGVGKTTTIGKLSYNLNQKKKSVMLAAGDTFRAAAVEQLQVWGQQNDIPVISQRTGADPASVIFDAMQSAKSQNIDVLIADTAGRLQNKFHLMEELKKIVRVIKKLDEFSPHEIMLVIDASTGQNAINQTEFFHNAINVTGIVLTKLDGTAKGGVIFSIADRFSLPIRYIGIGNHIKDLQPFDANEFVRALFTEE